MQSTMHKILTTGALVVTTFISGCASNKTLEKDALLPKGDETLVVFKINPSNAMISLLEASVENGFVKGDAVFGVRAKPVNDYAAVLLKANKTYKISQITLSVMDKPAGVYYACDGAKTVTFSTTPGQVAYITDLTFSTINAKFNLSYNKDFRSAKKYIDENFPNLKGFLVEGKYEMATPVEKCGGDDSSSVVIVPYIPNKR